MNSKDGAPAGRNPAKGERKTAHSNYITKDQFGPVEKVRLLALAASMADLTRSELATLNVLADMINAGTGQAWPSFNTLAARTGITPRSAKRAIRQLSERKPPLVILARPGNRVRSNRYELNRAYFAELDALGGSDARDTTVVTRVSSSGDVEGPKVVTHVSHKSIPESEHKAKDEGNRSGTDGAAPDRPRRPPGLPQGGDRFPEFWEAMGGRRTTVADAEQLLTEALEAGTDYQEVIEGAKRYKSYCDATSGKMKSTAAAWLKREAWRDGWELPTKRTISKPSSEKRRATKERQEWDAMWEMYKRQIDESEVKNEKASEELQAHLRECLGCFSSDEMTGEPDSECYKGETLHKIECQTYNEVVEWMGKALLHLNKQPEDQFYQSHSDYRDKIKSWDVSEEV